MQLHVTLAYHRLATLLRPPRLDDLAVMNTLEGQLLLRGKGRDRCLIRSLRIILWRGKQLRRGDRRRGSDREG